MLHRLSNVNITNGHSNKILTTNYRLSANERLNMIRHCKGNYY